MDLFDSTTTANYKVALIDFKPCYYRVAILTSEWISYLPRFVYVKPSLIRNTVEYRDSTCDVNTSYYMR